MVFSSASISSRRRRRSITRWGSYDNGLLSLPPAAERYMRSGRPRNLGAMPLRRLVAWPSGRNMATRSSGSYPAASFICRADTRRRAAKLLRPFAFQLRGRLLLAFGRWRLGHGLGRDRLRRDDGLLL